MKKVTQDEITYCDYDALDLPEGKFTKVAETTPPFEFSAFCQTMLRTAAIWDPSGDPNRGFGTWRPLDTRHQKDVLRWVRNELIVSAFSCELGPRHFVRREDYWDWNIPPAEAFKAVAEEEARVGIKNGKPIVLEVRLVPYSMHEGPAIMTVTDHRISWLHNKLTAAAQCTRPHSQGEIDALLAWADNEFAVAGVDSIMFPQGNDCRYLSDPPEPPAKENAQALVSVSRGYCHVEWTGTTAVFEQHPELYRPGQNFGLKTPASIASALAMRERHRVIRFLNAMNAQTAGCLQTD